MTKNNKIFQSVMTTALLFLVFILPVSAAPKNLILNFKTIWTGYGSVNYNTGTWSIAPQAATTPDETHSTLLISNQSFKEPYTVNFKIKTLAQLRQNSNPNNWEVGWFIFGYKPNGKFKYIILKPNSEGLEYGESLLNDQQNYLWTSDFGAMNFPVNQTYNVQMTFANHVMTLTVNGTQLLSKALSSSDYLNFNGKIGLYSEDALVQYSDISVQ